MSVILTSRFREFFFDDVWGRKSGHGAKDIQLRLPPPYHLFPSLHLIPSARFLGSTRLGLGTWLTEVCTEGERRTADREKWGGLYEYLYRSFACFGGRPGFPGCAGYPSSKRDVGDSKSRRRQRKGKYAYSLKAEGGLECADRLPSAKKLQG